MNLARHAIDLQTDPDKGYEEIFLLHLKMALGAISKTKPKIITNAGALNPKMLATLVDKLLKSEGVNLKVAYVTGDNVIDRIDELTATGETFHHLESDAKHLNSWELKPASANAYVGARGIYEALKAGADIVISGRCTDASPVIASAAWYHGWSWEDYGALAGALLAGHCIECGAYVTGGNSSGFLAIKDSYYNMTMGIAEINADGTFVITKRGWDISSLTAEEGFNGWVTDVTVRSQILYEIQGNVYLNPDVQALIDDIKVTEVGKDRVLVTGVKGLPPPDTTKVAICGIAGYQAEVLAFATGLDVEEKFDTLRLQITKALGEEGLKQFTMFDMRQYGVAKANPNNEAEGTAMMRIFAQATSLDAFGPTKNLMRIINPEGLGHFPGFHWQMDYRSELVKVYSDRSVRSRAVCRVLAGPCAPKVPPPYCWVYRV